MAAEPHSISDTVEVSFQIACPCGQVLTVGPTMVGQAVRCPRCATLLEVPSPDESAVTESPPPELRGDGRWKTAPPPQPPRDNFIAEELKRDAAKQPPPEPEQREPIDPTPLIAVLGGTILVLALVGLGFYTLDRFIDDFKRESEPAVNVETEKDLPAGSTADK
ncbi:MAG: hypothetical protein WD894_11450 [Pirellulales bacterium]